jgi:hypothetical protein
MFGLFKLKKKSKKDKKSLDDEKENTSSPTKVKKVENEKQDAKSKEVKIEQVNDVKVEHQQPISITIEGQTTPSIPRKEVTTGGKALTIETNLNSPLSSATTTLNIHQARCPMLSGSDAHTNSFVRGVSLSHSKSTIEPDFRPFYNRLSFKIDIQR